MDKPEWEQRFDEAFPIIYLQYYGYKANEVIKDFVRELLKESYIEGSNAAQKAMERMKKND